MENSKTQTAKIKVKVKQIVKNFPLPAYQTEDASGLDLYAAIGGPILIQPGEIKLIPTGIMLSIPSGYEGQIRPRSGIALKYGITVLNTPGTIDADYRGEVNIILINMGKQSFLINSGDRIAQLVFNRVIKAEFELAEELDETRRNDGGFGHTGN
uniref:dUTP diphosphatase n=1 Tax=Candidatus Methanophaga sp. ANME-1 ERB7 TaxID=2759913 RepID=A0A7G9Z2A9_9EURY|nr:deoxyuridine 5'-triphosphate nucleotidohydrolase [Methanosarcinales archaeon ANME-1 ERB7]